MKRYSILVSVLAVLLLLASASASLAILPVPDGFQSFQMFQGWAGGKVVWYICTDTNDIRTAQTQNITLAPKLSSGFYGAGVAAMFVVLNPASSQGPVFETVPGQALYSGIWRIRYVTWRPGFTKVPLTSIGQILALNGVQLDYVETNIRVDYPIVAVGQLGGPWWPAPPGAYRIYQAIGYDPYAKRVTLPFYNVFCQNATTKAVTIRKIIVTDAATTVVAREFKANYAPMLGNFPFSDTMRLWVILNSPYLCQLPVVEACPTYCTWRNTDYVYSPVQRLTVLARTGVAPSAVINNPIYIRLLKGNGQLSLVDDRVRINAPVVP